MLAIRGRWTLLQRAFSFSRIILRDLHTSQSVINLLQQGRWDEAENRRNLLLTRGETLAYDPVYEIAAKRFVDKGIQDYSAFSEWLDLIPEASDQYGVPFPDLANKLLKAPKKHMEYLKNFAIAAAEKGYSHFSENMCLPSIKHNCCAEEYDQFMEDWNLMLEEKSDTDFDSSNPHAVYRAVVANLPETLPEPNVEDPGAWLDEIDIDYGLLDHHPSPMDLQNKVLHLLREHHDSEAHSILGEMLDSDFHIEHRLEYEHAAIRALENNRQHPRSPEEIRQLFRFWFSLFPPISVAGPRQFRSIHRLILDVLPWDTADLPPDAPTIDIELVMEFGLICAEKGYGHSMIKQTMVFVMNYGQPERCAWFIEQFLKKNAKFWSAVEDTAKRPWDGALDPQRMREEIHRKALGRAIRCLAGAEKLDIAFRLLDALSTPSEVSTQTYLRVLSKLQTANNKTGRYSDEIDRLKSKMETLAHATTDRSRKVLFTAVKEPEDLAVQTPVVFEAVEHDSEVIVKLARDVRQLKQQLTTTEHSTLRVFEVGSIMARCMDLGRPGALHLLRHRLLRTNRANARLFLFAEMLFYYHRQEFRPLVWTFVQHFYLVGVPSGFALKAATDVEPSDMTFLSSDLPVTPKLHPDPQIIALAYHGLVYGESDYTRVRWMYRTFLDICRGQHPDHNVTSWSEGSLRVPLVFNREADRATFMPFLDRIMAKEGPSGGTAVINDMLDLKILPSVYHFTELAMGYTRKGDERLFTLMDKLEENFGPDSDEPHTLTMSREAPDMASNPPEDSKQLTKSFSIVFPTPDLIFYMAILESAIHFFNGTRHLPQILDRLLKRHAYEEGAVPDLDELIHLAHLAMERKGIQYQHPQLARGRPPQRLRSEMIMGNKHMKGSWFDPGRT